jgi:hypothetical protein
MDKIVKIDSCTLFAMKKAPIAVALVLVSGLFAAAFSLAPAVAQNLTSNTTGNATTTGNLTSTDNATSTNETTTSTTNATGGETFSASGSIASLIFDTGEITTTSEAENDTTTTASNDTSMTGNMTTGNMTTGNMTTGNETSTGNGTTLTLPQILTGGNVSDNATSNVTSTSNMTSTDNMTSTMNETSTSNETSTAEEMELPYVLAGDWTLEVQDGSVSDFAANFTMVHVDGTGRHTHELSNFVSSNSTTIDISGNGTSFIFGTVDVASDGEPKWTGADALVIIEKNNVISISLATEDTEDHFMGQPIYGIIDSMTDESGNEMIETGASAAGNVTDGAMGGNTTGGNATGSNETGSGFLGNLSEGIGNLTGQ